MHLVTFIFVSIELVILFYLGIHKLARPDDKTTKLNIVLILLLLLYNITGGLLPDPKMPGSFFAQEIIAYATGFITPCYFPYYVYKVFGLERLKFHAYKGVYLFIILPYLLFVIVFALSGSLEIAETFIAIPAVYAIWVIVSLVRAVQQKYNSFYEKGSKEELTALLLSIIPWIGLPVVTYLRMGQPIEATITNVGFLLLFSLYVKRNITQLRTEHEKIKESELLLRNWNADLREEVDKRTKELKALNEQRTNNFINLVHETKTPVTLVQNYLDEYIDKHGTEDGLDIVKGGIDKLTTDIVNLFDMERFLKGMDVYHHNQVISFSLSLRRCLLLFEPYCRKQNIRVAKEIEEKIFIKADPNAINRIINNLIENAIKYTDGEGEIRIKLSGAPGKLFFIVEDSGIGIHPGKHEQIFEPYYQINHKTTNFEGMGLGLPIVKKIVTHLNGTIQVESNPSLSPGTKISVALNRYYPKENDLAKKTTQSYSKVTYDVIDYANRSTYEPGKSSILLIEDNRAMNHFLFNKLSLLYNVFCAQNGADGLQKLRALSTIPNLILLDIMMDKMDGIQFAKIIAEQDRYSHIPIIFLTAKASPEDRLEGLKLGAIDFISKPFSFEELAQKISSLFDNLDKQYNALLRSAVFQLKTVNKCPFRCLSNHSAAFDQNCKLFRLTPRETEIARLIEEGTRYKEIARKLFIAEKTVSKHIQNMYEKVKVSNKIELINKLSH